MFAIADPLLLALFTLALGFVLGLVLGRIWAARDERRTAELIGQFERKREADTEALLDGVKLAFSEIALEQLRRASEQLAQGLQTTLAAERRADAARFVGERDALEARLSAVSTQLERLLGVVRELERDREAKLAAVAAELARTGERIDTLAVETGKLARVLGQARLRGQWGERLAEDLLRAAGLVEGVSWVRQKPLSGGGRPDITFLLPDGARVHLDVKFPFEKWLAAQDAPDEAERKRLEAAFLQDVRAAVAEVARRAYSDPTEGSIGLALLFVPNEALAASIWNLAPELFDEALARKVLLVSPASLVVVLLVIRRALEAFRLEGALKQLAAEAEALAEARSAFEGELERLGKRLEEALKAFRAVQSIRMDRLDRHLDRLLSAAPANSDRRDGFGVP